MVPFLFQRAKLLALEEVIGGQFPEEEFDFVSNWMKTNYVKEELEEKDQDQDEEGPEVGGSRDSEEGGDDEWDRLSSPKSEPEEEQQNEENLFQCSYTECQKTFLSKKFLCQPKCREHTKNNFTCNICEQSFKQSCNLKRHEKVHESADVKMKPFKELSEKQQVRRMQVAHEEALVKDCQCNPEGKRTGQQLTEFKIFHMGYEHCTKCLQAVESLSKHICEGPKPFRPKKPKKDKPKVQILCIECGVEFRDPGRFYYHKRTVHRNGDVVCHICSKVFNSVTIKGHLQTHNPKTPCDICGKLVAKMKHHVDTVHQVS